MAESPIPSETVVHASHPNLLLSPTNANDYRDLQRQPTVTDSRVLASSYGTTDEEDEDDEDDDDDESEGGDVGTAKTAAASTARLARQASRRRSSIFSSGRNLLFGGRRKPTWRHYPLVHINDRDSNDKSGFPDNTQRTTKYTLWNFLPKNLFEQFRRASNIYFLAVVIITLVPQVSPLNPVTSLLPVIFVLVVTAAKEAIEDYKRYREDRRVNTQFFSVLNPTDGKQTPVHSKDLKVGDVLALRQDDSAPADCVLLWTALPDGLCYVDTAQLDGETNLKELRALPQTSSMDEAKLCSYRALVEAEVPHSDLYKFRANLRSCLDKLEAEKMSLGTRQLLLRGARLRNTPRAYAAIVYNGRDTKLTLNQRMPDSKFSTTERLLNRTVLALVVFQLACVLVCTVAGARQTAEYSAGARWYLGSFGEQSPAVQAVINFFSYFVLLSFIIPMSLMVTLEVVKLLQAKLMEWDDEMRVGVGEQSSGMRAKTSNLNDELGLVKYIFSDKTGTLTENRMVFSKCSINGMQYELPMDGELRDELLTADWTPDSTSVVSAQVAQTADFVRALALCHSSIAEINPDTKEVTYQAQSPDEISLCDAAKLNDFVFYERTSSTMSVRELGVERHYELLTSMEFTSERRRMSVIVRTPEGKIKLFAKGSDAVMLSRLSVRAGPDQVAVRTATAQHLDDYSKAGLRTLVVACKDLTEDQFRTFDEQYRRASAAIVKREQQVEALCDTMERELRLVGCTAIEDKLQQHVPEPIAYLLKAGIRVWVITGDKQETAINIGYSSSLLDAGQPLVIVDGTTSEDVGLQIRAGLKWFSPATTGAEDAASSGRHKPPQAGEPGAAPPAIGLVLNGSALTFAITDHGDLFLKLAAQASSVVCCRVTPLQKAQIVQLVRRNLPVVTLAIGDGANDVSMIQVAHIGVGIFGKEGTQAARASDYAIQQFSHLRQLITVHGRYSLLRNALCIQASLYKNLAFFYVQFWFSFYNDFSGQTLVDDWIVTAFNIVLTSLPPLFIAFTEKDISEKTIFENPETFREVSNGSRFSYWSLSGWFLSALYHSIVFYWACMLYIGDDDVLPGGRSLGLWGSAGLVATYGVLTCLTKISLETTHWTWITGVGLLVSLAMFFTVFGAVSGFPSGWPQSSTVISVLFGTPSFYFVVAVVIAACLLPDFTFKYVQRQFFPQAWQILQEHEQLEHRRLDIKTAIPRRRRRSSAVSPQTETVSLDQLPIFEHDLSRDSNVSSGIFLGPSPGAVRRNQVRPSSPEPREIFVRSMSRTEGSIHGLRTSLPAVPPIVPRGAHDPRFVYDAARGLVALRNAARRGAPHTTADADAASDANGPLPESLASPRRRTLESESDRRRQTLAPDDSDGLSRASAHLDTGRRRAWEELRISAGSDSGSAPDVGPDDERGTLSDKYQAANDLGSLYEDERGTLPDDECQQAVNDLGSLYDVMSTGGRESLARDSSSQLLNDSSILLHESSSVLHPSRLLSSADSASLLLASELSVRHAASLLLTPRQRDVRHALRTVPSETSAFS
eukprot:TRINITY_DN3338_c0_g4_i1.p1 TRINITY_DN3338_c0_g4~~TRINITY_DN3338_c0_g4_i1.p1  ORF type:complete len:1533 (+),score=566.23 TRINITY_DN3338_c0_g4_i1:101-4699(+)